MSQSPLSGEQRQTLDALCRRIVPAAFDVEPRELDLPAVVERVLAEGDKHAARRLALLLSLFGSAASCALSGGPPRPFSRLSPDRQDTILRRWERSTLAPRRAIFQAFRRLIVSTYYAQPETHAAIGYLGPLHRRTVQLPWEGLLPGETRDDEPVARGSTPEVEPPRPPVTPSRRDVVQGHEIESDIRITADVCVVGSGAGGAVVAARLAEAGLEVVILEEGGYYTTADFTESEAEMVPRMYADRGMRATDDLAVTLLQGRCVGGGTTLNWMLMLRTPDFVLEEWAQEHGAEGMSPAEMAPVFDLVEEEVHAREVPADAHAPNNRLILTAAERLGWRVRSASINAQSCIRAGSCALGCRYGAKQSTLAVHIPRALAAGARLYSDARVDRIELAERGGRAALKRIHGVVLDRLTGMPRRAMTVIAPTIVLAAGAVGTPAILQRSRLGGGGVGRYLRLHPTTGVLGVYDRVIYGAAGIPQSVISDEYLRSDTGDYGFWVECPGLLPGLGSAATPGFGAEHRYVMQRFPHLGSFIVLARDGADRRNSDGEVTVARGGRVRIRYRVSESTARTLRRGMAAASRMHLAAGASEALTLNSPAVWVRSESDIRGVLGARLGHNRVNLFSAHVNGTCRVGRTPATSGVTPDFERHGAPGIYVADGSLLPTAPAVNPQETIMALGHVVATRLLQRSS